MIWNTPQNTTVYVNEGENFAYFLDFSHDTNPVLISGNLPDGLTYDANQVQISGAPQFVDETTAFPLTFRLTDGVSVSDLAINIIVVNSEPVWMTQSILGSFKQNNFIDFQFVIFSPTSSEKNIIYDLKSGIIPDGLTLTSTGNLTGLLTSQTGIYEFTLSTDVGIEKTFSIEVSETTSSDPYFTTLEGWVGNIFKDQFFSFQFEVSDQTNSTFSVDQSELPDGLNLTPNGFLSGVPSSDEIGNIFFDITIDGISTKTFYVRQNILIEDSDITIQTEKYDYTVLEDEPSSIAFTAISNGNVHIFSISDGILPDGLSLQQYTGLIQGRVNKGSTGLFNVIINVSNNIGGETQFNVSINVLENNNYTDNKIGVMISGDAAFNVYNVYTGYNIPYEKLYRPSDKNFGLTKTKNINYIRYVSDTKEEVIEKLKGRLSSFGKPFKFKTVPVQDSNGIQVCECVLLMMKDDNTDGRNFNGTKLSSLDILNEDIDSPNLNCYNWQSDFYKVESDTFEIINHDFYTGKKLYFKNQNIRNPLVNNTPYYAIVVDKDNIKLAETKSLALQSRNIDFNGALNNRKGILHTPHNAIPIAYVKIGEGKNIVPNLTNKFKELFEKMKFSTNFVIYNDELLYHDENSFRRL